MTLDSSFIRNDKHNIQLIVTLLSLVEEEIFL